MQVQVLSLEASYNVNYLVCCFEVSFEVLWLENIRRPVGFRQLSFHCRPTDVRSSLKQRNVSFETFDNAFGFAFFQFRLITKELILYRYFVKYLLP